MKYALLVLIFFSSAAFAQQPAFKVIPLGIKGGGDESSLSCYMIAASRSDAFVCLDAGTINAGLEKAAVNHLIKTKPEQFFRKNIKGYLISHGHLDHLSGLVLNSPDDSPKNIYVLPFVKEVLKEKYFTPQGWTNFADEGEKPLNKYHYVTLDSAKEVSLAETNMFVTAFPLSHGNPYKSSAFLIRSGEDHILYLGDTGADIIEGSQNLHALWQYISPIIKTKKLKAIFIECSFPNEQPDNKLFGHLTPKLLLAEMQNLTNLAGIEDLKNIPIVVTHIKPAGGHEAVIKKQIAAGKGKLKIAYPVQGKMQFF